MQGAPDAEARRDPLGQRSSVAVSQCRASAGASPVLVHVVTIPGTLCFLIGQPRFMHQRCGFEVHAIAAPGPELLRFGEAQGVTIHPIAMARRITPLADVRSVWKMWLVFLKVKPRVVHAHTPKGGLLGMAAAWLARVPVRVYHMHGFPILTATHLRKYLLRKAERISCALAHQVLCVSHSVRKVAIQEGICDPKKIKVLLDGSVNGVDTDRIKPATVLERAAARAVQGISPEARVIGYVGRLARDKGIFELAAAWGALRNDPHLRMLIVGGVDDADPPPIEALDELRRDSRVHFAGQVPDIVKLYAAMDVVVLPTYREGFTTVALEAAAMALPLVASAVPGCVDAVEDGVTGTLVPVHQPAALVSALLRYLADPALCAAHGAAARRHVLARFRPEAIWEATAKEYEALLDVAPSVRDV